jgi:curved DNA-binding protein CbpA
MSLSVNDYIKYDLYQLFLLNKNNFTLPLLRKAYQRQVLVYHPDKFSNDLSEEDKKEKMDTFLLINNGYTILSNNTTKEEYDNKREAFLNEEKGFGNLKSQFFSDKKKYTPVDFEAEKIKADLLFKQTMEDMNNNVEKNIKNTSYELLEENQINNVTLQTESIKPSDNFTNELSNITANRNIKLENNNIELYTGLTNSKMSDKYAFIDEAFK